MLYGMGQAGMANAGLPTDQEIQQAQCEQELAVKQLELQQKQLELERKELELKQQALAAQQAAEQAHNAEVSRSETTQTFDRSGKCPAGLTWVTTTWGGACYATTQSIQR